MKIKVTYYDIHYLEVEDENDIHKAIEQFAFDRGLDYGDYDWEATDW